MVENLGSVSARTPHASANPSRRQLTRLSFCKKLRIRDAEHALKTATAGTFKSFFHWYTANHANGQKTTLKYFKTLNRMCYKISGHYLAEDVISAVYKVTTQLELTLWPLPLLTHLHRCWESKARSRASYSCP